MSDIKQLKFAIALAALFAVAISANDVLAQSGDELVITGPAANQKTEAPKPKQDPVISSEENSPKTFSVLEFPIEQTPITETGKSVQLKPPVNQTPLKLEPPKTEVKEDPVAGSFDSFFKDMVRPPENFDVAPSAVPGQFADGSKKDNSGPRKTSKPSVGKPDQTTDSSKSGKNKDEKLPSMKAPKSTNYKKEAEPTRRGLFHRFRQNRIPNSPGQQNSGQQNAAGETLRIRVPADPDKQPFAYRSDTFQQEPSRRIRLFRRR